MIVNVLHLYIMYERFALVACPPGKYGFACLQDCQCSENSNCDHVSGDCICKPGHTGIDCARGSI